MDEFLRNAIDQLAASGKLAEIYNKIHRPYVEWQPSPPAKTEPASIQPATP